MDLLTRIERPGSGGRAEFTPAGPVSKRVLNIRGPFLTSMGNRSDRARTKTPRRARKHKDLLAIWLDLFKQVDNPPCRQVAANATAPSPHSFATPPPAGLRQPLASQWRRQRAGGL